MFLGHLLFANIEGLLNLPKAVFCCPANFLIILQHELFERNSLSALGFSIDLHDMTHVLPEFRGKN